MLKNLEIFDNRILILYILDTAKTELTVNQIVSFCIDFDDITYFDICDYLQSLLKNKYIEQSIKDEHTLYSLTDSGLNILSELLELIPGANLYKLKKIITKNIVNIKTEYTIGATTIPIKSDEYKISCFIKDGNDELLNITIYAGNKEQTKNISKNWQENSDKIYTYLLKELTKEN